MVVIVSISLGGVNSAGGDLRCALDVSYGGTEELKETGEVKTDSAILDGDLRQGPTATAGHHTTNNTTYPPILLTSATKTHYHGHELTRVVVPSRKHVGSL